MSSLGGYFCQSLAGMFIQSIAGMRACASLACEIGACCFSTLGLGYCVDGVPKDMCPASATVNFHRDTQCDAIHCGSTLVGACCGCSVPTGPSYHCQTVNSVQCKALGGSFKGNGTACNVLASTPVLPGGSTCNYIDCFNQGFGNTSLGGCCFFSGICGTLPQCHCNGSCNPFGGVALGTFLGPGHECNTHGQLCPNKGTCCNAQTGGCSDFHTAQTCSQNNPANKFNLHEKCGDTNKPNCPGRCITQCGSTFKCVDNITKSACTGGTWTFGVCP